MSTPVADRLNEKATSCGHTIRTLIEQYDNGVISLGTCLDQAVAKIKEHIHSSYDEGFRAGAVSRTVPETVFEADDGTEYEVEFIDDDDDEVYFDDEGDDA